MKLLGEGRGEREGARRMATCRGGSCKLQVTLQMHVRLPPALYCS